MNLHMKNGIHLTESGNTVRVKRVNGGEKHRTDAVELYLVNF